MGEKNFHPFLCYFWRVKKKNVRQNNYGVLIFILAPEIKKFAGMCQIFSRTGIPNELLTDQGSECVYGKVT